MPEPKEVVNKSKKEEEEVIIIALYLEHLKYELKSVTQFDFLIFFEITFVPIHDKIYIYIKSISMFIFINKNKIKK